MKLVSFLLRSARGSIALAALAGLVSGAGSAAAVGMISSRLAGSGPLTILFVLRFAGLIAAVLVSGLLSSVLLIHATERAFFDLQISLCRQILAAPLRRLEEIGSSRLLAVLSEDILSISSALFVVPSLFINLAIMMSCLVYLGWLSPGTLLALLVLMVPAVFGYRELVKRARRTLGLARAERDVAFGHYRALTEGAKELKLHQRRRRSFFSQLLQPAAASYLRRKVISRSLFEAAATWSHALYFLFILALFALITFRHMSTEVLTGYALVALYMRSSLGRLMGAVPVLGRASVALQKIDELGLSLAVEDAMPDSAGEPGGPPSWERLDLVGATHTYPARPGNRGFALGPIDLSFRPGELVFVTGGNGSGKTTLVKLLSGLYVSEAGEIRLDGTSINTDNRESYRQQFSVVFSDPYLFDRLLGLDSPHIDRRVRDILARLHLDHTVEVEDGQLSTTELSHGQRKRLALLTAYLEDRPIYVFDEWAAGQDPQFKELFYLQLLPELHARGKLVVVVSHDDHYYRVADRIIELSDGKIESDTACSLQSLEMSRL